MRAHTSVRQANAKASQHRKCRLRKRPCMRTTARRQALAGAASMVGCRGSHTQRRGTIVRKYLAQNGNAAGDNHIVSRRDEPAELVIHFSGMTVKRSSGAAKCTISLVRHLQRTPNRPPTRRGELFECPHRNSTSGCIEGRSYRGGIAVLSANLAKRKSSNSALPESHRHAAH